MLGPRTMNLALTAIGQLSARASPNDASLRSAAARSVVVQKWDEAALSWSGSLDLEADNLQLSCFGGRLDPADRVGAT
jgi:hypothetical protein